MTKQTTRKSSEKSATKKEPRKAGASTKKPKPGPSIDVGGPPGIEGRGVSVGSAKDRRTED